MNFLSNQKQEFYFKIKEETIFFLVKKYYSTKISFLVIFFYAEKKKTIKKLFNFLCHKNQ